MPNYIQSKRLANNETWIVSMPIKKNVRILIESDAAITISYDQGDVAMTSSRSFYWKGSVSVPLQFDPPNLLAGNMLYIYEPTGGATPNVSIWVMEEY